ncbi:MAG: hypothetical protein ACYDCJ_13685 [Gammaproteobacteria bacterium]
MKFRLPKLHAAFKVGGILLALAALSSQVASIGGALPHPTPLEAQITSAAEGIGLILAAFGVHPGDTTAQAK